MSPSKPSARAMIAAALLVMAAILAFRVSAPVSAILHDVHVRMSASVTRAHPPEVPPKVVTRVRVVPVKFYPAC